MLVAFLLRAAIPAGFGLLPLFSLYGGLGWAVLLLVFLVLGELFFRPSLRKEPNI